MTSFLFPLGSASAQEDPPPERDVWRLSRAEALRTAVERNLDLVIVGKDPKIAEWNVEFLDAGFDPALTASALHSVSVGEPSAIFVADRTEHDEASVGWAQNLRFGGNYSLGLSAARDDVTVTPFTFYNPSYNSGLAATFVLPLLKGLGVEETTRNVILARDALDISRETLRTQAHTTIKATDDAYWDLHAAIGGLDVARQSLDQAQDLFDLNKKKVEVGTLAPIEITQAEAGVASREEGVIVAETTLANSEDNLRRLLAIPKDDPAWDRAILPTDAPTFEPVSPDLDASIAKALEARPELVSARHDLRSKELSERVAKSDLKPQLDLTAIVTPGGNNLIRIDVAGPDGVIGTSDDNAAVTGGLSQSFSEIPKFRNYYWSVGLVFTYPIGNHGPKATYAISTLNREKSELSLANLEQSIRVDVRTAVRNVESGAKRVNAARSSTTLQRKKLEAEQKKFENGMSTSFEVLTFQTDLANAQLAEITALVDYNKALADLERAKGTLLEANGLQLDESVGD
jgi:outer membrane protein TolC